jgi:superfamily II DNA/RNA helicase
MSTASFADLGVSDAVIGSLSAAGITAPFSIQRAVIGDAIAGRDVIAKSPTGSGKTLAFGIPLVERISAEARRPAALVLAPTRELASQIVEDIRAIAHARALRVTAVYGGAGLVKQARDGARSHVLVATPGRLEDLLDRGAFTLDRIRMLVLDEADRMLDMGFRPQVEQIVRLLPAKRQTMLFSATLDGEVGGLARAYTHNPSRFEAELPSQHSDGEVEHRFVAVTAADKVDRLVELLQEEPGLSLVFVRTKRGADRLAHKLRGHGVRTAAMHGDMTQRARERALERFRSENVTTLVATDVAARGLDLEAIAHVINYDPPEDTKGYVHRVGRTGRAGRTGQGTTLVLPDQQADVSRVANLLGHREQFESGGMKTARQRLLYTSRRGRRSRW